MLQIKEAWIELEQIVEGQEAKAAFVEQLVINNPAFGICVRQGYQVPSSLLLMMMLFVDVAVVALMSFLTGPGSVGPDQ